MEVKPRNSAPEAKENQNPSQSSAVIIAAVLGSVAIIAVVMFSIALVAMVRRRQRQLVGHKSMLKQTFVTLHHSKYV